MYHRLIVGNAQTRTLSLPQVGYQLRTITDTGGNLTSFEMYIFKGHNGVMQVDDLRFSPQLMENNDYLAMILRNEINFFNAVYALRDGIAVWVKDLVDKYDLMLHGNGWRPAYLLRRELGATARTCHLISNDIESAKMGVDYGSRLLALASDADEFPRTIAHHATIIDVSLDTILDRMKNIARLYDPGGQYKPKSHLHRTESTL